MSKSLCLTIALLFSAILIAITAGIAEAGSATTAWGMVKNYEDDDSNVKAAPPGIFAKRKNIWDGLIHSNTPSRSNNHPKEWRQILGEIGNSIDIGALTNLIPAASQVDVWVEDMDGNLITQIRRGNLVRIVGVHSPIDPFKGTSLMALPVTDPAYTEVILGVREFAGGVSSEWYYFYIPDWSHVEGTAMVIVLVDGIGYGYNFLDILP